MMEVPIAIAITVIAMAEIVVEPAVTVALVAAATEVAHQLKPYIIKVLMALQTVIRIVAIAHQLVVEVLMV